MRKETTGKEEEEGFGRKLRGKKERGRGKEKRKGERKGGGEATKLNQGRDWWGHGQEHEGEPAGEKKRGERGRGLRSVAGVLASLLLFPLIRECESFVLLLLLPLLLLQRWNKKLRFSTRLHWRETTRLPPSVVGRGEGGKEGGGC